MAHRRDNGRSGNAPHPVPAGFHRTNPVSAALRRRIKAIAAEHNNTMVENVALARALAKEVDTGKPVPTKWYQAVAEVLAMVYRLKKAG
ncbi:MAG: EscU/YscU/HrcU family type III secretion system export apparatus switch protein [Caulobacterales bacterium]|nr:EscU/YscU/HrcU family type III secretion system export apparatus switch protein [Caulobacterales bacterium]